VASRLSGEVYWRFQSTRKVFGRSYRRVDIGTWMSRRASDTQWPSALAILQHGVGLFGALHDSGVVVFWHDGDTWGHGPGAN
jgi:hypothetical protein